LGTLTSTPDEVDGRLIYYKHADARFYQAGAFLLGKQISQLPLVSLLIGFELFFLLLIYPTVELYRCFQLAMEIIAFGLPFYFISGLVYEAQAFFVFLAILIGM
jgi:hypothetical protein